MARQKRTDLLFVADRATEATSVYDAAADSCIVACHVANARSGRHGLSLAEREQVEKDFKKLAAKLGRKVSSKGRAAAPER
jgi:hypothetical protein